MTIKSFRKRAEELEKELGEVPYYINGKYSLEFEEWLRENRNKTEEEKYMNREIRFRAWNKVDKTIYTDVINNCKDTFDMVLKHPQIYEVMQYTGLKDRNAKEIYEGDILSRKEWGFGGYHEDEERYTVEHLDYYLDSGEENYHFRVHLWGEYCEVIGNIYENPELLREC